MDINNYFLKDFSNHRIKEKSVTLAFKILKNWWSWESPTVCQLMKYLVCITKIKEQFFSWHWYRFTQNIWQLFSIFMSNVLEAYLSCCYKFCSLANDFVKSSRNNFFFQFSKICNQLQFISIEFLVLLMIFLKCSEK